MADHPHTIDRWDDATGENLIEQIAGAGDYLVALATYRAAVKRWPKDKITLRNRARIIERSWEDWAAVQGVCRRKRECRTKNTPPMVRPAPIKTGQPFPICSSTM
jgi:hypothetical protein